MIILLKSGIRFLLSVLIYSFYGFLFHNQHSSFPPYIDLFEMIHQFKDVILTHVLLQQNEETYMARRLVLVIHL